MTPLQRCISPESEGLHLFGSSITLLRLQPCKPCKPVAHKAQTQLQPVSADRIDSLIRVPALLKKRSAFLSMLVLIMELLLNHGGSVNLGTLHIPDGEWQ